MKTLILSVFLAASSLLAADPGTVTVNSIGVVTADSTLPGGPPVRCTFQKFGTNSILTWCFVAGVTEFYQFVEPAIGSSTGSTGIFFRVPNVVSWTLRQPSAGVFTWNVVANGFGSSGSF